MGDSRVEVEHIGAVVLRLAIVIKVVDLLTLSHITLVERFRASFLRDATNGSAGVPFRAALR